MANNGGSCPEQYELPKTARELQDLIEHRKMNFAQGNIFKACWRDDTKNDWLYEVRKIRWFAEREEMRILGERGLPIDYVVSGSTVEDVPQNIKDPEHWLALEE